MLILPVYTFRSPARPSVLLPYLISQNLPRGFLQELVFILNKDKETFSIVFTPILQGLLQSVRGLSFDTEDYRLPLATLSELCEIKVTNTRPVCNLVSMISLPLCVCVCAHVCVCVSVYVHGEVVTSNKCFAL